MTDLMTTEHRTTPRDVISTRASTAFKTLPKPLNGSSSCARPLAADP